MTLLRQARMANMRRTLVGRGTIAEEEEEEGEGFSASRAMSSSSPAGVDFDPKTVLEQSLGVVEDYFLFDGGEIELVRMDQALILDDRVRLKTLEVVLLV